MSARVDPCDRSELSEFEDYFGFLDDHAGHVPNTMATDLELPIAKVAGALLAGCGWQPGKHAVGVTRDVR